MQEFCSCFDVVISYINSLPRRSLPKTEDDINAVCTTANTTGHCLKDFSKRCMTPIQRELAGLMTEGFKEFYDQLCVSIPSKIRTDYLAHGECLNKVTQGEGTNNLLHYFLAVFQRFLTLKHSDKIQYLCCGYTKIYHAFRSDVVNTCTEEAAQAIERIYHLMLAQLPNVICTGVDGDSEECTAILPPPGAKPTEEIKENAIYKTVFNLLKNYLEWCNRALCFTNTLCNKGVIMYYRH